MIHRFRRPDVALSTVFLALVLVAWFFPGVLATHDPFTSVPELRLQPPSAEHFFGTDHLGRDVYSRVVHGTALSLSSAVLAVIVGVVVGGLVGLIAGFVGGRVDFVLMRLIDVVVAIPNILLALIVVATMGFGPLPIAIGVGLSTAGGFGRVMRSQVVKVRNEEYVEAAATLGVSPTATLFRHVLPNSARPVVSMASLELGTAVLNVSALTFLGFGAPPPAPEWGALVNAGRDFVATDAWLSIIPGMVILLVVLSVNSVGRAVNEES